MEAFQDVPPLWDFSNTVAYPQMQDEDFMNLLQKQFPTTGIADPLSFGGAFHDTGSINPQSVNTLPLHSSLSPPSEDSSPSPSNSNQDHDEDTPAPKRKASDDDDFEDGPSAKSQHTMNGSKKNGVSNSASTAGSTSSTSAAGGVRRKSTGNSAKDENRLMKRKEQNRAAQRAFRERKEKHVKDLEDRVAELEAKNEEANHENDNLRDLLTRLQSENVILKQQFTFSMPRDAGSQAFSPGMGFPPNGNVASGSRSSFSAPSVSKSPEPSNPLDWSSLHTFDPTKLNLLDEAPQTTATEGAMQLDFGFGNTGLASNAPYTSIASNPMFMSFASSFDSSTPISAADSPILSTLGGNGSSTAPSPFNFDMNSLTPWTGSLNSGNQDNSLDDLFQGYNTAFLTSPAGISPVTHHAQPSLHSTLSSPSSTTTDPLFTPKDAGTPETDSEYHDVTKCPKTKADIQKKIDEAGLSPFASGPGVQKCQDSLIGTMISCSGSVSFPKTQRSEKNVEVLTAWRSITSNPQFKQDTDISELCSEFTAKARCDGHKVVLEPQGVVSILENLSKKRQQ
ncbi:hypothetical protein FA15DRAFT_626213 [Coprinopsis marcescibilis]|uniref:BZIP domain-containing protein n=1 Tax=Coprinopsis marcescibilis TaxID=230819 RepID=A0A5C3KJ80_COPMA|nr:hypothetical protein FA15DRAFT_626213 [Coprinopsis marcescibilis]